MWPVRSSAKLGDTRQRTDLLPPVELRSNARLLQQLAQMFQQEWINFLVLCRNRNAVPSARNDLDPDGNTVSHELACESLDLCRRKAVIRSPMEQKNRSSYLFWKVFHMCWTLSDGSAKLISIDEQPND